MQPRQNKIVLISIVAVIILLAGTLFGAVSKIKSNITETNTPDTDGYAEQDISSGYLTLDDLMTELKTYSSVSRAEPHMGQIQINDNNLYDELPEIERYPLQVQGNGQVDIEIFTSGEKAGSDNDAWLVETAQSLNRANLTLSDGQTVSLSVRSMGSGLGADYILSGKYIPDLYNPSNELFGDYAIANGANMELYQERLVGNTAGILVRKNASYTSADEILADVISGELHLGYTNPQNSATGANLLIYLLQSNGGVDSEEAKQALQKFNGNVPFIAYTTQQMTTSAANGSFDAIVSEYQAYINDQNLTTLYNFIPFGLRHDNPVYITGKANGSAEKTEAIALILDYLNNTESQKLATKYGFNANDDYDSSYSTYGAEVGRALAVYKQAKDAGKDIIAVFVADCSGSMRGEAILQLKDSLSNGIQYINENNLIGLVSYADDIVIEMPIDRFDMNQKAYFQGAIDQMQPNGSTYSYEALCVAMNMIRTAQETYPDAKPMIFLLSDGDANGRFELEDVTQALKDSRIPVYTISYNYGDNDELNQLSNINEAASIKANSDDIVYQIKTLFNSQL